MNNFQLEGLLNDHLGADSIKDYCPNGLQVEGKAQIKRIVTGVTACQALIDASVAEQADAILVHHGYFWRGESEPIKGIKYKRIKTLIEHGINLYAYHLPLDVHPVLGNNVQLAKRLGIEIKGALDEKDPHSLVLWGELASAMSAEQFSLLLQQSLGRAPLHIDAGASNKDMQIKKIAWCSGAAQDFIDLAAAHKMDAYISGEISERTTFLAKEQGIHYFAAGHHATERFGVKALGHWLQEHHGMSVKFIDIDNPV